MTTHYLALTIDTDPDGLNTNIPDRNDLRWDGLHYAMEHFHQALPSVPLTWYVRADGQLEHAYGSARWMLDTYADFWHKAIAKGDELGWHPHLYTIPKNDEQAHIITETQTALSALTHTWEQIQDVPFDLKSFRMGEAWHTAETLNLIEEFGFTIDSTAIPDRDDSQYGHPRNWRGAPNQPYYPDKDVPRKAGKKRSLVEVPMNSWYFQASYDASPKLRYMNPCIHPDLWDQALERWQATLSASVTSYIWVFILHPAEAMPHPEHDLLYAYSIDAMQRNLEQFQGVISDMNHTLEAISMSQILSHINL